MREMCFGLLERHGSPSAVRIRLRIEGIYGLLKDWKINSQELKDELRKLHG